MSKLFHLTSGSHDQAVKNGMSRQILIRCAGHPDFLQRSSLANSAVIIALRRPSCSDCHQSCAKASTNVATRVGNARVNCHSSSATTSGSSGELQS